jgi:hypothetical protein
LNEWSEDHSMRRKHKDLASMAIPRHPLFAGAALVATAFSSFSAHGQQYPTALELAQMPKFCYAQFPGTNATGDEYKIQGCGPAANHYCYGLMQIIRAKSPTANKPERLTLLKLAMGNIQYTETAIKDYPTCPIREHVAASKAQVLNLQRIYGGTP